jgi:hypothetical protein
MPIAVTLECNMTPRPREESPFRLDHQVDPGAEAPIHADLRTEVWAEDFEAAMLDRSAARRRWAPKRRRKAPRAAEPVLILGVEIPWPARLTTVGCPGCTKHRRKELARTARAKARGEHHEWTLATCVLCSWHSHSHLIPHARGDETRKSYRPARGLRGGIGDVISA